MFVHPALGLTAIGLILGAFAMKAGQRKFWRLHYVTGLTAGAAGIAAFSVAIWAVLRRWFESGGQTRLPFIASVHLAAASLGLLALITQVTLGLLVHNVLGGPPKFLRFHRRNARLLVILAIAISVLGLATLGMLMV